MVILCGCNPLHCPPGWFGQSRKTLSVQEACPAPERAPWLMLVLRNTSWKYHHRDVKIGKTAPLEQYVLQNRTSSVFYHQHEWDLNNRASLQSCVNKSAFNVFLVDSSECLRIQTGFLANTCAPKLGDGWPESGEMKFWRRIFIYIFLLFQAVKL